MSNTQLIKLELIKVDDRVRELDAGWVTALADDICEKGQLQAIGVRKVDEKYILVFGEHRLAAMHELGLSSIEAKVLHINALQAKVIEIDENILRMPFRPLDFAHALRRRKEIYEDAFPQSKNGAAGLIAMNSPVAADQNETNFALVDGQQSYCENTAERLGCSKRKIELAIWLSFHFTRNAEITLRDHDIMSNGSQVYALAKLPPEDQEKAAELIADGTCKNVGEASDYISGKVAPTASVKTFNKVVEAYAKTDANTKTQIIETLARHGLPAGYVLMVQGVEFK